MFFKMLQLFPLIDTIMRGSEEKREILQLHFVIALVPILGGEVLLLKYLLLYLVYVCKIPGGLDYTQVSPHFSVSPSQLALKAASDKTDRQTD